MPEPNKAIKPCPTEPRRATRHGSRRTSLVVLAPAHHVPLDETHERQAIAALEELLAAFHESRATREATR
jgi:hypothetical protein